LTPAGNRGKVETPQGASPRRLDFLPAGKQVPAAERNGLCFNSNTYNKLLTKIYIRKYF
jgi:hypothetical protein